ncbi:MAG: Microsomal dipeptidase, partial [Myxococcaceae bacterium]|nr:Microsomal dipeptidase [Myxococcaceae bacterium]
MQSEKKALRPGISDAARALYLDCDVVDLHIDSFIWRRLFGYDLQARHGRGLFDACFYSQSDLPRLRDAQVGGAVWVITTNPLRRGRARRDALLANVARLTGELTARGEVAIATSVADYRAARARGAHAAFLGIQGGNALELSLDDFDRPELSQLLLVTLLHFTRSRLGAAALPPLLRFGDRRLSSFGADYVRKLNDKRILVDLAH